MYYKKYKNLAPSALGQVPASLVLKNAKVVNVFTEEVLNADIAIEDGIIVGVGDYSGKKEVDLTGKYVCPGFIDAHLHLESTLAAPKSLVFTALERGTTAFIADPHEAANVAGEDGIQYIIDQTEGLDATVFVMIPSCVPVSAHEENGSDLDAKKMKLFINHPRVLGLGEVMDFVSVVNAAPNMMEKLELFKDKVKDGHAPGLSPYQLSAYALAKIKTDHECIDYDYAMQQSRNGMFVLIREGSGAKNLEAIVSGLVANRSDTSRFSFCTDDKHISDIESEGHIDHNIRKSIALGMDPIKAIKMATINTANCYGLEFMGAVAPGYRADMVVLNNLSEIDINSVYCNGNLVIPDAENNVVPVPKNLLDSIHVPNISRNDLALSLKSSDADTIEVVEDQIITRRKVRTVNLENGFFIPDSIINKAVVIERHKSTGHTGVAPISGFEIKNGAIGTSLSHDSHNIVIIGDNDDSILIALEELKRVGGGYTIVSGDKVHMTLPLPIMGLMTEENSASVDVKLSAMIEKAHEMGIPAKIDPLIVLSFIALTVIPEIRITTVGLFDSVKQEFIER